LKGVTGEKPTFAGSAAASFGGNQLASQLGQLRLQQTQMRRGGLVLLGAGHLQSRQKNPHIPVI